MLILTRRIGETICVGHDIRVMILEIKGGQVRIGIEAPPAVTVDREEVYARKQREKRSFDKKKDPEA